MNLESCLHPIKVRKAYTGEVILTPCGKCEACRAAHNAHWTQRLTKECDSHKYTLFVTLTYDDNNLPIMRKHGNTFVGETSRHRSDCIPVVSREDVIEVCSKNGLEVEKNLEFFDQHSVLPYCSVQDAQNFIKRLRKNLATATRQFYSSLGSSQSIGSKDTYLRYWCTLEYGPTTYRPHMHLLLWFSSEIFATKYNELIHKSWKYGFSKSEFPMFGTAASSYVAKYVNCFADLPAVFQCRGALSKSVFSRYPAIGTLSDSPDKVSEIFNSLITKEVAGTAEDGTVVLAPLLRCYKDRTFPKLTLFDSLSHADRTRLYSAPDRFGTNSVGDYDYRLFERNVIARYLKDRTDFFGSYAYTLLINSDFGADYFNRDDSSGKVFGALNSYYSDIFRSRSLKCSPLYRWFSIACRVSSQARAFGVTINEYVYKIEEFYKKIDYERLESYFEFQRDLSSQNCLSFALAADRLYLERLFGLPSDCATLNDSLVLESYGIPSDWFFGLDIEERKKVFSYLYPENNILGINYRLEVKDKITKASKTKKKNDALGVFGSKIYSI